MLKLENTPAEEAAAANAGASADSASTEPDTSAEPTIPPAEIKRPIDKAELKQIAAKFAHGKRKEFQELPLEELQTWENLHVALTQLIEFQK